jgi:hypothetical protein
MMFMRLEVLAGGRILSFWHTLFVMASLLELLITPGSPPVGKIHDFLPLDNMERSEDPETQSEERQHKKNPGPEFSLINALGVGVTREKLGIDVIPEVWASALRAERMKDFIPESAPGTGERLFIVGHGVSAGFLGRRVTRF